MKVEAVFPSAQEKSPLLETEQGPFELDSVNEAESAPDFARR